MELADLSAQAKALTLTSGVMVLPDWMILEVRGEDARTWLNGQVTNDVQALVSGIGLPALTLNAKGKILAELWIWEEDGGLFLALPSASADTVIDNFQKYIVMEDVEIKRIADLALVTVQGPRCREVLESARSSAVWNTFASDRLGTGGMDLAVPGERTLEFVTLLTASAASLGGGPVTEAGWELARLRAGIPRYGFDFGDDTLPQEAGLKDRLISFSKGCYLGQEAVTMLEHRGRPPRRLVRLSIEADKSIARNMPLDNESGTTIGRITSSVLDPDLAKTVHALGYVKREHAVVGSPIRVKDYRASISAIVGET